MINTGITDRELEELLRMYEDASEMLKQIHSDSTESDNTEQKRKKPNAEHEKL